MNSSAPNVQDRPKVPAAGIPVGKGDLAVSKSADASIAQRHAKDVGSQVLERRHTAVHRLAAYGHPVLDPHLRRYFLKQIRSPEGIPELRPVEDGQRFRRQEETLPAMAPALPVLGKPAAWNQVVHMRMIRQVPCPCVQHTNHTDPPTHEAGILGQLLCRRGAGPKDQIVDGFLIPVRDLPQPLRHGERQQEIGDGESQLLLPL